MLFLGHPIRGLCKGPSTLKACNPTMGAEARVKCPQGMYPLPAGLGLAKDPGFSRKKCFLAKSFGEKCFSGEISISKISFDNIS